MSKIVLGLLALFIIGAVVLFSAISADQKNAPQLPATTVTVNPASGVQEVYVRALSTGAYDKAVVNVKKGVPVRFHFSADLNSGCGKMLLLDGFQARLVSYQGEENVATFTPTEAGTYAYHCGMNMFRGKLVVS